MLKYFRCDNHYVLKALTPADTGKLVVEFEQEKGFEHKLFKDEREGDRNLTLDWINWWNHWCLMYKLIVLLTIKFSDQMLKIYIKLSH